MVGLWTIRLFVQVQTHWVQFTLARKGYDNHNCHNKPQIGNGTGVWMTSCLKAMGWEFGYFVNKMPNWEPAADRGLWSLIDLRSSNPAKMRKKYCWVNIAVYPHLQLISHTTSINPFENKVWEIYFYKEVCSFVHWSLSLLLTMFPLIFVLCICMWLYNRCTSWTLTKPTEKKLDGNYTRLLWVIFN